MEKRGKILWLSDGAGLATGYATISRKLMNYLADMGWEIHFLEHTSVHQTYKKGIRLEDDEEFKFTLHGAGIQPYCQDIIETKIRELKPDIFGILLDTFMCYPWILNKDFAPAKSVFYFPSDGGSGLPLGCENVLKKMDKAVAMSQFAQKQVKDVHGLITEYIPHAIEPDVYKPLSDQERLAIKAKFGLNGKFVIGTVARNQGRKMLDRMLEAFALVKDKMPNAVLMLHTDKFDPAGYFNFDAEINRLNLQNRIIFTGMRYYKGFDYKKMNEVYNAMDVFFLCTSGEGFGIPTVEAMSAGIPVMVTDYTTTEELVTRNKCGEAIKLNDEILGTWNVKRGIMDVKDAGEKMIKLYNNPELRKEYGKNGREAVLRDYSWPVVAKQFDKLFMEMIK